MAATPTSSQPPYRQIRALYDDATITVYQAYSAPIAEAAVREQRLDASPEFLVGRMTWVKPSWCWMMYRSGYSTKEARQSRILALKLPHDRFKTFLSQATVTHGETLTAAARQRPVRVQWDPERTPRLGVLPYRSIQIGIGGEVAEQWIREQWVVGIADVTDRALRLKEVLDGDEGGEVSLQELVGMGLVPVEREWRVEGELREVLKMDHS